MNQTLKIDLSRIQCKKKYISGINYGHGAERNYQLTFTLKDTPLFSLKAYMNVYTKKSSRSGWDKGKATYFWSFDDKKDYPTIIDLLKSKFEVFGEK